MRSVGVAYLHNFRPFDPVGPSVFLKDLQKRQHDFKFLWTKPDRFGFNVVVQGIVEVFEIQTTDQCGEPSVVVLLFLVVFPVLLQLCVFTNFAEEGLGMVEGRSRQFLFDFVFVFFLTLFAAKRAATRIAARTTTMVPHAVFEGFELVHQLKTIVPQVQHNQDDGRDEKESNGAAVNGLARVQISAGWRVNPKVRIKQ